MSPRSIFGWVLAIGWLSAAGASAQFVYWLDTNYSSPSLNRCFADGSGRVSLALPAGSLPEGLAVDATHRTLYWTESSWTGARVRRCGLDFGAVATVDTGGSCLRGLVLDEVNAWLYALSSNNVAGSVLLRSSFSGPALASLTTLGSPANPRGIVLDASRARLIWCDFDQGRLMTSSLTGSSVFPLVSLPGGAAPFGLAYDAAASMLYWTDYAQGTISRQLQPGGAVSTVLTGLQRPTYLAVDHAGNRMFWIEAPGGANVLRSATLAGASVATLPVPVAAYGGVAFVPGSVYADAGMPPPLALGFSARSPNPAHDGVVLECAMPRATHVRVSVYDVAGRELARLLDDDVAAGRRRVQWDARGAASGVYFASMHADGRTFTRRLVVR